MLWSTFATVRASTFWHHVHLRRATDSRLHMFCSFTSCVKTDRKLPAHYVSRRLVSGHLKHVLICWPVTCMNELAASRLVSTIRVGGIPPCQHDKSWRHPASATQNCNERTNALSASRLVSANELAASRLGRHVLAASRLNIISKSFSYVNHRAVVVGGVPPS